MLNLGSSCNYVRYTNNHIDIVFYMLIAKVGLSPVSEIDDHGLANAGLLSVFSTLGPSSEGKSLTFASDVHCGSHSGFLRTFVCCIIDHV